MRTATALAALALLAGCGGTTDPATEGAADRLEEAAEQSTPAAGGWFVGSMSRRRISG